MSFKSRFASFVVGQPTSSTTLPWLMTANQLRAIEASVLPGGLSPSTTVVAGWNYTNSVTRSEDSPGTAAAPARAYFRRPGTITNNTEWIKLALTWNATPAITKVAAYYSSNNESDYVPMLDERGFYVCTITYSGTDLASTAWGNTP